MCEKLYHTHMVEYSVPYAYGRTICVYAYGTYRIEQNFVGTKFWRNCDFKTLAEKTLANPRLACIYIIVRAR